MRARADIERDLSSARARLIELQASRRHLEASATAVSGRIAEFEAELALLNPERCRLVIVGPRPELAVDAGGPGGRGTLRIVRSMFELCDLMGWQRPASDCAIAAPPVTIFKVELGFGPGDAA